MVRKIITEANTVPSLPTAFPSLFALLAVIGMPVFILALVGISSRPIGSFAAIWPANAFLLAMMIRGSDYRSPAAWVIAFISLFLADLLTGASLFKNVLLNLGNLFEIAIGLYFITRLPPSWRGLQRKYGFMGMLGAAFASALAGLVVGAIAYPMIFGGSSIEGAISWSITGFINYIAFMPVILAAPSMSKVVAKLKDPRLLKLTPMQFLPGIAAIILCIAGLYIDGPSALVLPVIALLWSALRNSLFTTAVLTLFFCNWTLLALALGYLNLSNYQDSWHSIMSWRLGITVIALVPIIVAAHTAARHEELERIKWNARHDSLTGALNRGAFFEELYRAIDSRNTHSVAFLMMDLDHFKSINDRYGHPVGDRVLRHFKTIAESCLRKEDTIGRLGGEEFAVLLPDCPDTKLHEIASRIIQQLEAHPLVLADDVKIPVTVSIGSIVAKGEFIDPDNLLDEADQALYEAKRLGRNQVVRFEDITAG